MFALKHIGNEQLTHWRSIESLGNLGHVDDDRLDAVAFALNLSHKLGHLIAIELIG